MKGGREYRRPLSDAAMTVVEHMRQRRENGFLFPGDSRERLSNMAFLMLLRRMKRAHLTAYGFRATLKTWAAERTNSRNSLSRLRLLMCMEIRSKRPARSI